MVRINLYTGHQQPNVVDAIVWADNEVSVIHAPFPVYRLDGTGIGN